MLNLLSKKSSNSHARPATLPNASHSSANVAGDQDKSQIYAAGSLSHVNGQGLDIPSTIPELKTPPPASKGHQRSYTDNSISTRELPPLITSQLTATTTGTQSIGIPTHRRNLSISPDSPRQPSPTRSRIKTELTTLEDRSTKLSSWFQGESQPIKVGLVPSPTKEKADPLEIASSAMATRPTGVSRRSSSSQVLQKPAMASRFSYFNSKAFLAKPTPPNSDPHDILADLDIHATLFPAGPPDPFSPAAFKNLQQQAEGLLSRLQVAYKERATALREMAAEKEAMSEESQGAETRARHLKMQLDAMSEQLAEQDKAMMTLVDDLAQEKVARREEEEARKRSVRLVGRDFTPSNAPHSRPRRSINSDSGLESEDESSADSVFSRRDGTQSPTMSMSSVSTDNSPETFHPREILHSPTQAARLRIPPMATKPVQQPCTNCHGVRPTDAWLVVSVLKEENQSLKERVGELEGALDGCLDVVGRLGG